MMKFTSAHRLNVSLFAVSALLSWGCFGQTTDTPLPISQPRNNTVSVKTVQYLLQTATLLYEQKNITASKNILNSIDTSLLTPELEQAYVLQQAALAVASNDSNAATVWLNEDILTEIPMNDIKKQTALHELRAKTYLLKKQFLDCAKEYLNILSMTPEINQQPYTDALWNALSKMDSATLNDERLNASSGDLYNWIDLALITKDNSLKEDDKKNAIQKWFSVHPHYPVPSELFNQPNDHSSTPHESSQK